MPRDSITAVSRALLDNGHSMTVVMGDECVENVFFFFFSFFLFHFVTLFQPYPPSLLH
jgi:hypothetical protein